MHRCSIPVVSCFALACVAGGLAAQSNEKRTRTRPQRFFDWTSLTFPVAEYSARRVRLAERIRKSGGGVFLIPSAEGRSDGFTFRQRDDFLYFTGLELPRSILAIEVGAGEEGRAKTTLFAPASDRRFANPARRNDFPGRPLATDPDMVNRSAIADVRPFSEFARAVSRWEKEQRAVFVNSGRGGRLPPLRPALWEHRDEVGALRAHLASTAKGLTMRNGFDAIAALRMIKSPAEIAILRRACDITSAGIRAAAARVEPGVDERTLEGVLEAAFKSGGAQRPAFASIIKSGPNSLWPWRILAAHYDRRNRKVTHGDLVIFDVGCELHGYASDVGRTVPVLGEFSPRQRQLVEMVTAVSDAILEAVKPGTTLRALQQIAQSAIPKSERKYMQTGLFFGHHVGLAVGDPSHAGAPLAAGMVFTVEPWYYNHDEQIAVFVEDMVLVTEHGAENLTAGLPRQAAELERLVKPR